MPAPSCHRSRSGRPRRPAPLLARLIAGLAVALLVAAAAATPAPAQDPGAFPAPLYAPMLTADQPPSLQFGGFYAVPEADAALGTTFVVVARTALEPNEGYRLSIAFGRPDAEHDRATLRISGGEARGALERGAGGDFTETAEIPVELVGNTARLTVPAEVLGAGQGDDALVWLDAEDPSVPAALTGSLFPLDQLVNEGEPGVLTSTDLVWMPDGSSASLPPSPALSVDGDTIALDYSAPLPTEVGGVAVQKVTDIVRVVDDFSSASRATHLITVNHGDGRMSLVDATDADSLPIEIEPTGPWDLTSYPTTAGVEGASLEFDLSTVLESFGVTVAPGATALGVSRSIDLVDGSVVRPDGVLGTLQWFETGAAVVDDRAAPTGGGRGDDGREVPVPLLVAVAIIVLAAVGAWLWVRSRGLPVARAEVGRFEDPPRHRLTIARSEPPPAPPPAPPPSSTEQAELDRITETIFGQDG